MAWGINFESTFGQFSPEGEFARWREQREAYFNRGLTDEELAGVDPNNALNSYVANVSRKFNSDHGPIAEHEWPVEFRTKRVPKRLGSIFRGPDRVLMINEPLKSTIEQIEPDTHTFREILVASKGGTPVGGRCYLLVIGQFLESFSSTGSDEDLVNELAPSIYSVDFIFGYKNFERIALKKSVHTGKHLWREPSLAGPDFFISDDLHNAIVEQKLLFPKHARVRDV
ncbi:MAG: DUF1629 domain-containing protein [Litoreibacter sp.]